MKPAKLSETKSTIRFSAKLLGPFLTLPKNASAKLRARGMTSVEGTIDGLPFQAALEPTGYGSHRLRVSNAMHDALGADAGDTVTVEITRAADEPEIRVPMDLRKALRATPAARGLWEDITPIARRDWIFWIIGAKQPETRRRRIEKACAKLSFGKRRVCCFGGIKWLSRN